MITFGIEHNDCDNSKGNTEREVDDVANCRGCTSASGCDVATWAGTHADSIEKEQTASTGETV